MSDGSPGAAALSAACDDVVPATAADAVDGVRPELVARPRSAAETAEVLAAAAAHELVVVARGAGTKLSWGAPPSRVDVVVDLSGQDAVLDHAAGDLIAVAQAGCPIATLQKALAPAGQRLALDETVAGSTIGGAVATNLSGPRRMLNGTLRDLMIGTTVVRADGLRARSGGRVVKNVAGYDLGKLITGSFGTLAVITEAVFRLHPLPEATAYLTVDAADGTSAGPLVAAVVHSAVVPSAVEVDCGASGCVVAVLLEGSVDGVAERTRSTRALLDRAGASEIAVASEPPSWWGSYPWSDGQSALKLTTALSGLSRVLAAARRHGAAVRGSAGSGVLYAALPPDTDHRTAVSELRLACRTEGGSLVLVDAPPAVKAAVDQWGPVPALDLMRAVKQQFDPGNRLAPGRFVGGI